MRTTQRRPNIRHILALGLLVVAFALPAGASAADDQARVSTFAAGMHAPRGLLIDANGQLVAVEGGTGNGAQDGRVVRLSDLDGNGMADNDAERQDLLNGLPSSFFGPHFFGEGVVFGPSDAVIADDGVISFVTAALVEDPFNQQFSAVWSTGAPNNSTNPLRVANPYASLVAYEIANNPDGRFVESNPYAIVAGDDGVVYVNDAAANTIYKVMPDGTVSTYTIYATLHDPNDPSVLIDVAPTGLVWGPDGALYSGAETGGPWIEGLSRIYRMADENGDGDALDAGEQTIYATGLTTVTDIAFDNDGHLLATEFRNFLTGEGPGSGRVVRLMDDGSWQVVAGGLTTPTGTTVGPDGTIYVSEEYIGQIVKIQE